MSRNRKDKRNETYKINKIIPYPGSKDIENVPTNEKKSEKNLHERKFCFRRIIEGIVIALVSGIIVIFISRYLLSPRHINISTSQDGLIGHVDIEQHNEECIVYFMNSNRSLVICLDNNSDQFIRITDIYVNVIKFIDIKEEDITFGYAKTSGYAKKPICLDTKIGHNTGKMETEIDREFNPEYYTTPNSYIEIPSDNGEKFIISMDFEKQGYYKIEVEFNYMHDGKIRTIKTDPLNCIFLERDEG